MGNVSGKLTVYFEKPFWVGVFERIELGIIGADNAPVPIVQFQFI